MVGIMGTGVGGEGFGWSFQLRLGSRCVIFCKSFLSILTHAAPAQGFFLRSFQGMVLDQ